MDTGNSRYESWKERERERERGREGEKENMNALYIPEIHYVWWIVSYCSLITGFCVSAV